MFSSLSALTLPAGMAPATFALLAFSALVAGLARGFSGFGGALIFMPLATTVIDPKVAAVILFSVDAVLAWPMIPDAYRQANRKQVATMLSGAVIGVPLGTLALAHADPLVLRWAIVALVGLMLALLMSGWRYRRPPTPAVTVGVGGLSGLFAGAAQVGGPPVIAYWLGGALPAGLVRANIVFYFALGTVVTGVNYWLAGLLNADALLLALAVAPTFGIGLYLGSLAFGRASETIFRRICYSLIGFAAVIGLPLLDPLLRG